MSTEVQVAIPDEAVRAATAAFGHWLARTEPADETPEDGMRLALAAALPHLGVGTTKAINRALAAMEAEAAWLKAEADKDGDRDYTLRAITAADFVATAKRALADE